LAAVHKTGLRAERAPFGSLIKAAAHFGQIRAELARLGTPCGAYDMLIGAHARSEGLVLVTNNVREFLRIPGLRVDNWVDVDKA
jgi:tRNA(fMet)-specific endonuclease VapC